MGEKKDLYSEVKGQLNLSERIASFVPGFRGYKEKELRRESDKLIRNHLYVLLTKDKNDLKIISQKLADRRYLDVMTNMDRLLAKADRISEKINHASYGYTGFFDAVKVREENLDRMIEFDNQLVDGINEFSTEIASLKDELATGETKNLKTKIDAVTEKVEKIEDIFGRRAGIIIGVT
jgi:hypothetical protein